MSSFFLRLRPWQALAMVLGIPLISTLLVKFIYERFDIFTFITMDTAVNLWFLDIAVIFISLYIIPVILLYSAAFGLGKQVMVAAPKKSWIYAVNIFIALLSLFTVLNLIPGFNTMQWMEEDVVAVIYLALLTILPLVLAYLASRAIRSAELGTAAKFKDYRLLWVTYLIPFAGLYIYQLKCNEISAKFSQNN